MKTPGSRTFGSVCVMLLLLIAVVLLAGGIAGQTPAAKERGKAAAGTAANTQKSDSGKREAADESEARVSLVLSELSVDPPPGQEGSWVEIYNPGTKAADARGLTIVCNGETLFTFLEGLEVPPEALIVVRFGKGKADADSIKKSLRRFNTATIWDRPAGNDAAKRIGQGRRPGYCALFAAAELAEKAIVDYVQWGRIRNAPTWEHSKWAARAKIWDGPPVYVGIPPIRFGPPAPPQGSKAFVAGIVFPGEARLMWRNWVVLGEQDATPGTGNLVQAVYLNSPWHGSGFAVDDPPQFSFGSRAIGLRDVKDVPVNEKYMRLQVAEDPHFRKIVLDEWMGGGAVVLDKNALGAGRYYARVRCDVGSVSTNWSEPIFFSRQ